MTYDEQQYRVSEQIVGEIEEHRTTVTDAYGNAHVHHDDDDLRLVKMEYPAAPRSGTSTTEENQNRTGYTGINGTGRSMSRATVGPPKALWAGIGIGSK